MDRREELDRFKRINLSLVAAEFGFELDRKKSTKQSVLMRRGSEKIVISRHQQHYVFFSVHCAASGTVIDFLQQLAEPGCSLGRVRQVLRPFIGRPPLEIVATREFRGNYQRDIGTADYDQAAVHRRYQRYEVVGVGDSYLEPERGIPAWVLSSPRVLGRLRRSSGGAILFPHWDDLTAIDDATIPVSGYEIKHRGVSMFSKGGRKGLWMSGQLPGDDSVALVESGLDGLSLLALRPAARMTVCSVGGQIGGGQVAMIERFLREMRPGAQVLAAFDQDEAGTQITERLRSIFAGVGRGDLVFREDRPSGAGQDWNDLLRPTKKPAAARLRDSFQVG